MEDKKQGHIANQKVKAAIINGTIIRQDTYEICGFHFDLEARKKFLVKVMPTSTPGELDEFAQKLMARFMEAHHDDYSKPFEVRWLCASCHKRLHLGILYSPVDYCI